MSTPSTLRARLDDRLLEFCWRQWAQLGVAGTAKPDPWAVDPEALLVCTADVGRRDPRLFDEVLDWIVLNGRLLSVQRLRNLVAHPADAAVLEAIMAWSAQHKSTIRSSPRKTTKQPAQAAELFDFPSEERTREATFAAFGVLRPPVELSGKSQVPDFTLPATFALRLRQFVGVGTRAEVIRCLLTIDAPFVTASLLAAATGYTRRNVNESLAGLSAARIIRSRGAEGTTPTYMLDRGAWAALLGLDAQALPTFVEWPQLLRVLVRLRRVFADLEVRALSPYMEASEARLALEDLDDDLRSLGFLRSGMRRGAPRAHWDALTEVVDLALARLES